MTDRESANIWRILFARWPIMGWQGKRLLTKAFWGGPYVFQDSFLTYWNRLIGCKVFGHRNIKAALNEFNEEVPYCFDCYRWIEGD